MSVFKIEKTKDYTIMSNYHLRDKSLSYKAKGLLSFMLSLPEDWDYSLNGLVAISKESRDGIRSILKELQEQHYLEIEKYRNDKGLFEYNYLIYEITHYIKLNKEVINPDMENPHLDSPNMEKMIQINTNKQNTKKQIDKKDKTKSPFFNEEKHNILTNELINKGYIEKGEFQIYYYDKLFQELLEENNSYKDLFAIIHYIVPRVVNRKFIDEDGKEIKNSTKYVQESF